MALGGTTMCPHCEPVAKTPLTIAVQNSYIDPEALADNPPGASNWGLSWEWLRDVSSATEFDTGFKQYLTAASGSTGFRAQVQDSLNCWNGKGASTWGSDSVAADNKTGPAFVYQTTALCSIMVGQPSSWACAENSEYPVPYIR